MLVLLVEICAAAFFGAAYTFLPEEGVRSSVGDPQKGAG